MLVLPASLRRLPSRLAGVLTVWALLATSVFTLAATAGTEDEAVVPQVRAVATPDRVLPIDRVAIEVDEAPALVDLEQAMAARASLVATPPPPPPPPPAAPAPAASPATASTSVWDRVAGCESGGDWSINTGNGYYGGLQFALSSWRWVGGTGYPHEASKQTQIAMAERLLSRQGWSAWPACSRKLGLR